VVLKKVCSQVADKQQFQTNQTIQTTFKRLNNLPNNYCVEWGGLPNTQTVVLGIEAPGYGSAVRKIIRQK
jgi:hypothetical protein